MKEEGAAGFGGDRRQGRRLRRQQIEAPLSNTRVSPKVETLLPRLLRSRVLLPEGGE